MTDDYCNETPVGRTCLVCERPGSWERPAVAIDDWYPKPPPPQPDPDPDPASLFWPYVALIIFSLMLGGLIIDFATHVY
jgi:hypothetical protein